MHLPINELRYGAWYSYLPGWLEPAKAEQLYQRMCAELEWEVRTIFALGKPVQQPRLMAWGGALEYRYSSQTLPVRELHPALYELSQRLSLLCSTPFNHVVLNRYRDGSDHMSSHADNEPELGNNPVIAALSLGSTRTFVMQPKAKRGRRKHTVKLSLEDGSLLVMGGRMQRSWRHAVPKMPDTGPRINITFRELMGAPGWRPPEWDAFPDSHGRGAQHQ